MPDVTLDNSFLTIFEADDILDEVHGAEGWAALEDDPKARLLIVATRQLRQLLNANALAEDADWTSTTLKLATALQAWFLFQNSEAMNHAMKDGIAGAVEKRLGSMTLNRAGSGFHWRKVFHPEVLKMLEGYYSTGKRIARV